MVGSTTVAAVIPSTMVCIATHESDIEQFRADGTPVWSPTRDVGVMQIHYTWIPVAEHMGLDIVRNPVDNIEFGIWLFNTLGPTQWTTYKQDCAADG
jgi:hypothetical protein